MRPKNSTADRSDRVAVASPDAGDPTDCAEAPDSKSSSPKHTADEAPPLGEDTAPDPGNRILCVARCSSFEEHGFPETRPFLWVYAKGSCETPALSVRRGAPAARDIGKDGRSEATKNQNRPWQVVHPSWHTFRRPVSRLCTPPPRTADMCRRRARHGQTFMVCVECAMCDVRCAVMHIVCHSRWSWCHGVALRAFLARRSGARERSIAAPTCVSRVRCEIVCHRRWSSCQRAARPSDSPGWAPRGGWKSRFRAAWRV